MYHRCLLLRFQFKDDIKAARNSATQVYTQYIEEPKTSQRRLRLEMEAELLCCDGHISEAAVRPPQQQPHHLTFGNL